MHTCAKTTIGTLARWITVAAGILPLSSLLRLEANELPHTFSWVGNSFGSGSGSDSGKWVQNQVVDLWVRPGDGRVYTTSQWDEAKREGGIYQSGDVVGRLDKLHPGEGGNTGRAVTGNASHVFVANGRFIRRYNFNGSPAPFSGGQNISDGGASLQLTPDNADGARGLAMRPDGTRIYATLPTLGKVVVVETAGMTVSGEWNVPAAYRAAVAANGDVWIAVRATATGAGKILRYSSAGAKLAQEIAPGGSFDPSALCFDTTGRLVVADNGSSQRLRVYTNLSGTPTLATSIGAAGGVFSGPVPGRVGPLRFNGLTGVGYDSAGNLYVSQNRSDPDVNNWSTPTGTILEAYGPSLNRLWILYGLEFVDNAGILRDATDGHTLYSKLSRYEMDWNQAGGGAEWTHAAHTFNRFLYPEDPRWTYRFNFQAFWTVAAVREIGGKRFIALVDMWGFYLALYRFDGEIMVPCGFIYANPNGSAPQSAHPGSPSGTWSWRDLNGNGRFEANEYSTWNLGGSTVKSWHIDEDGHLWWGKFTGPGDTYYARAAFGGFDTHGSPVWNLNQSTNFGNPMGFHRTLRNEYNKPANALVVSGYSSLGNWTTYGGNEKHSGPVIARINDPMGAKTLVWSRLVESPGRGPSSMRTEGDYVFVGFEGGHGATDSGFVEVYALEDGAYVGKLLPPFNSNGRIDVTHGLEVYRRGNGEYIVLVEDDWHAKLTMYRWTPAGTSGAAAPLSRWRFEQNGGNEVAGGPGAVLLNGAAYSSSAQEGQGALDLGASGAHATVGTHNLPTTFTLEAWVHLPAGAGNIRTLMANAASGASTNGFRLFVNSWNTGNGRIVFETGNGSSSINARTADGVFVFGAWNHVAVMVDRANATARIFHNGVDVTASELIHGTFNANATVHLGQMTNGQFRLGGLLDDVRITQGHALLGWSPDLSRWRFDNSTQNDVAGAPAATLFGSPAFVTGGAEGSHALDLPTWGQYASLGDHDLSATVTLSGWFHLPGGATNIRTLLANAGAGGATDGFRLFVNNWNTGNGRIVFETGNGSTGKNASTPVGVFQFGEWNHIAVVVNRAAGTARIYHNQIDRTEVSAIHSTFKATGALHLGRMTNNDHYLRGSVDDLRITPGDQPPAPAPSSAAQSLPMAMSTVAPSADGGDAESPAPQVEEEIPSPTPPPPTPHQLRMLAPADSNGLSFVLEPATETFTLQRSGDLRQWANVPGFVNLPGGTTLHLPAEPDTPLLFYRVVMDSP